MSRLRRMNARLNSLDLLLDTMCNTLGGIILIALLMALLSRDATSESSASRLQEQLKQTAARVTEAERLHAAMLQSIDTNTVAASELIPQKEELQKQIELNRQMIQSNTVAQASLLATNDPEEAQKVLVREREVVREIEKLKEQIEQAKESRQRQLRLPRERITGKKTFYFVMRYSKIYPVHFMRDGRRELNTQMLQWSSGTDGEVAVPRMDEGLDIPSFARTLMEIPVQTYAVHLLVYDDSFTAFLNARQVPLARGFDTGWEFLPGNRPVVFSSRGEAPPAL